MLALSFLGIGFVVWIRHVVLIWRKAVSDIPDERSRRMRRLAGLALQVRTKGILWLAIPFLVGYLLDQVFATTLSAIFD